MRLTKQRTPYLLLQLDGERSDLNAVIVILDEDVKSRLQTCQKIMKKVAKKSDTILEMNFHEEMAIPLLINGKNEPFLKDWLVDLSDQANYYLDCSIKEFKKFLTNNCPSDDYRHVISVFPNNQVKIAVYHEVYNDLIASKGFSIDSVI